MHFAPALTQHSLRGLPELDQRLGQLMQPFDYAAVADQVVVAYGVE